MYSCCDTGTPSVVISRSSRALRAMFLLNVAVINEMSIGPIIMQRQAEKRPK